MSKKLSKSQQYQIPLIPSQRFYYLYAISAIPADMLHKTWQELEYRLDVIRATNGAHIEVYWGQ
jgi:hypothetical protein